MPNPPHTEDSILAEFSWCPWCEAGICSGTGDQQHEVDTNAMARSLAFARTEWAIWEEKACALQRENEALRKQRDSLAPDEHTVMVRVARELLPQLGDWSSAVHVMLAGDADGVADLVFRDEPARTIDRITADRDRLHAENEALRKELDAARYARLPHVESGHIVCDTTGVLDAATVRTLGEYAMLHTEAMGAIASLRRSHEVLRTDRDRLATIVQRVREVRDAEWAGKMCDAEDAFVHQHGRDGITRTQEDRMAAAACPLIDDLTRALGDGA